MMDTKIIGIILLICAGLLFRYGYEDLLEGFYTPPEKLKITIQKDTNHSLETNQSKTHYKIHHVDIKYRSKEAHDFLIQHQPKFETYEDGTIWLEMEVLDLPDSENPGLITQISVFDLKTKNKISEFGQTYYFKDFGKTIKHK